jgi:potassium channel LctB
MGISFELFYTLIILYGTVIVGFGLIYFSLSFYQVILVEIGQVKQETIKESLFRSFYFSGVTMLTIGYGDIIPLGIGRAIAIIQALIGYLLPTSFVLKLVQLNVEALKDKES